MRYAVHAQDWPMGVSSCPTATFDTEPEAEKWADNHEPQQFFGDAGWTGWTILEVQE